MELNQTIDGKMEGKWVVWLDKNNEYTETLSEVVNYVIFYFESDLRQGDAIIFNLKNEPILTGLYVNDNLVENWLDIPKDPKVKILQSKNKEFLKYHYLGDYQNAVIWAIKALDYAREEFGTDNENYGVCQRNLGLLYLESGDYSFALPLLLEATEILKCRLGEDHPYYAKSLDSLAGLYKNIGEFSKALLIYQEVLENKEVNLGKNHPSYASSLNNLGMLYLDRREYNKALPLFLEAKEIIENNPGKDNPLYAYYLNGIAELYFKTGEFSKALPLYLEALENIEKSLGKDHPDYGVSLSSLASLYESMGEYSKALPLYLESFDNLKNQINNVFSFLNESGKKNFIKTIDYNFESCQSLFIQYYSENSSVSKTAYDIELLTKNLILNSGIDLQKRISASNDSVLIEKFEDLRILKNMLSTEYSKPISERRENLTELENRAEILESQINQKTNQLSKMEEIGKIKWEDVQKALKKNETAIEFSSFQYYNGKKWTDTIQYMALVLRKNDKQPVLIPLFTQSELDKLIQTGGSDENKVNNLYRGSIVVSPQKDYRKLYDLLWRPIEEYLNEDETIYFAPSGTLHQIAFSAISTPDGKYLSDKYRLHPVSSTAKILDKKENKEIKDITLFGDIDYDLNYDKIAKNVKPKSKEEIWASRSLPEDLDRGNETWPYLPGTREEVNQIKNLAKKSGINVKLFSGDDAVEENFKAMNGTASPQLLHIATHGFFFPDPEKQIPDNRMMTPDGERMNPFKLSDNPLNRAGLLFAGANHAWKGEKSETDDGILTAYEANNVYLPNTKLVVLSACDTGLGEIQGSEGVYGLQRAFKAAGAEYLLMSLWKVPDKETSEFMEAFYTELFKSNSIYDSYISAQNQMKEKYKDSPYKWAAFVLLR